MSRSQLLAPTNEYSPAQDTAGRFLSQFTTTPKAKLAVFFVSLGLLSFAAVLSGIPSLRLNPLTSIFTWLAFGTVCLWGGTLLREFFHPERHAYQQIVKSCSQATRETTNQELLLSRIAHILFLNLGVDNLSLWKYDTDDSVLSLLRVEGTPSPDTFTDLPFDLTPESIRGTWHVQNLPESALRQALLADKVQVITSLSLGNELVGFMGLGNTRGRSKFTPELFYRLDLIAAQLALIIKNAVLKLDLVDTLQKLHLSYRRTIDAQDEERRNLATELHDDILGRLTTMALALRRSQNNVDNNPEKVKEWLDNLAAETQSINGRLREITKGLHPSVLTDLGLISAIQAYVDVLANQPSSNSARKAINFTAQGFGHNRINTPKLERDIYYITRQALDNALKHACAEQIFIHLRWDEKAVSVTVRDTGQGMSNAPEQLMGQNGHLGLLSLYERAVAWQGKLTFNTGPGQGTTIRARLPINQPSNAPSHLQAFTQYLN